MSDKENPYGLHLDLRFSNRLLNHENTSRQEEGASKRLLLILSIVYMDVNTGEL